MTHFHQFAVIDQLPLTLHAIIQILHPAHHHVAQFQDHQESDVCLPLFQLAEIGQLIARVPETTNFIAQPQLAHQTLFRDQPHHDQSIIGDDWES